MIYTQIEPSYKYEVIADAIYAREVEHFHYNFDRINFESILENLQDCQYQENIKSRLLDTLGAMAQVETIISALIKQIDDEDAYAKAVLYTSEKRKLEAKK